MESLILRNIITPDGAEEGNQSPTTIKLQQLTTLSLSLSVPAISSILNALEAPRCKILNLSASDDPTFTYSFPLASFYGSLEQFIPLMRSDAERLGDLIIEVGVEHIHCELHSVIFKIECSNPYAILDVIARAVGRIRTFQSATLIICSGIAEPPQEAHTALDQLDCLSNLTLIECRDAGALLRHLAKPTTRGSKVRWPLPMLKSLRIESDVTRMVWTDVLNTLRARRGALSLPGSQKTINADDETNSDGDGLGHIALPEPLKQLELPVIGGLDDQMRDEILKVVEELVLDEQGEESGSEDSDSDDCETDSTDE